SLGDIEMRLLQITLRAANGHAAVSQDGQLGEIGGAIIVGWRYSIEPPVDGERLTAAAIGQVIASHMLRVEEPFSWRHQDISGVISFDILYSGVLMGRLSVQPGTSMVPQPILEIDL